MSKLLISDSQKTGVLDALDTALESALAEGVEAPSYPAVLAAMQKYSTLSTVDRRAIKDTFRQILASYMVVADGASQTTTGTGIANRLTYWTGTSTITATALVWNGSKLTLASGGLGFNDGSTQLSAGITQASLTSQLASYVTNSALTAQLANYVTATSLTSTLASYNQGAGTAGQLAFYTGAHTTSSDAGLVWDNTNKRLGIGITPTTALQVQGETYIKNGNVGLVVESTDTTGNNINVILQNLAGGFGLPGIGFQDGTTYVGDVTGRDAVGFGLYKGLNISGYNGCGIGFRVNGNTSVGYIDTNGHWGIGVPAGAAAMTYAVTLQGNQSTQDHVKVYNQSATGYSGLDFFDSGNVYKGAIGVGGLSSTAAGSTLRGNPYLYAANGRDWLFCTNDTLRMTLKDGGNLLIGTTADDGSSKLQVAGKIKTTSGGVGFPDNSTQASASTVTFLTVNCQSTDAVGDLVQATAGTGTTVKKADMTDPNGVPVIGTIVSKPTSITAQIQLAGPVVGVYSGLTPGRRYYVGSDGRPTNSFPIPGYAAGTDYFFQVVGVALDTSTLLLIPSLSLTLETA